MRILTIFAFAAFCLLFCNASTTIPKNDWVSLFDGKTLNGWKVGDNAGTFTVENGTIVAHGPTAHLFMMEMCSNTTLRILSLRQR